MSLSGTDPSISDAITKDHRELEEYYAKYLKATTDKEKTEWSKKFIWELARHSIGEEIVLYPAFEKHLGKEGKVITDSDRAEHQPIKKLLSELESTNIATFGYPNLFEKLVKDLKEHLKSEEEHDLPKLEAVLSREESNELAKSFDLTKGFVPTRPHPGAPDKPPFETVVGLLTAPIDKLKDAFSSFPKA